MGSIDGQHAFGSDYNPMTCLTGSEVFADLFDTLRPGPFR
jgi:hypothetical protein